MEVRESHLWEIEESYTQKVIEGYTCEIAYKKLLMGSYVLKHN